MGEGLLQKSSTSLFPYSNSIIPLENAFLMMGCLSLLNINIFLGAVSRMELFKMNV